MVDLFSGKGLDGYSALPPNLAKDYEVVKTAILERYDINTEAC